MINSKFKKISLGFSFILILTLILIFNFNGSGRISTAETEDDSNQISSMKSVIEKFIEDDYNFNGGKNDFSTVGNEDLKKYLIARNDFKRFNNKENNSDYTPFNEKYNFDYKKISDIDNNTKKVSVYVDETFDFTMVRDGKKDFVKDAGSGSDYVIYITNVGENNWKVMSATRDIDTDPIDADFNVNEILGYEKKKRTKRSEPINVEIAIEHITQEKNQLAEDLKKDLNPEVEKNLPKNIKENMNDDLKNDLNKDFQSSLNDPDIVEAYPGQKKNRSKRSAPINRRAIYDYAYKYRGTRRNPDYLSFKADCANYASQSLRYAGGTENHGNRIYIDGKYRTWSMTPDSFHLQKTYGDAWAQAHYLRAFITRNQNGVTGPGGHAIKYGSTLELGDLTFIHNKDRWFHTYIVVGPGPNFYIASHTGNHWWVPIDTAAKHGTYKRSYIHLTSLN